MSILQAGFEAAPQVKVMINTGALFDISTGHFIEGQRGEHILNGGLSTLTGYVGIGNNFKSTLMHFQSFTACARMRGSTGSTYDSEVNVHEWHLTEAINRIYEFEGEDILETGRWVITDKTVYSGNKWYAIHKAFTENKIKNKAKIQARTPFWNRGRTGPLMILTPTFTELDSLTEFETDDVADMQDKNELGDSGGNTIHMRQGLAKMRMLMEAPKINSGSYNYMLMTAHLGKESTMQKSGGGKEIPIVKLKHLKNGDKIKGVTDKFTFVTHNCWHAFNASPLHNKTTLCSEYPRDKDDNVRLDSDLNTVKIKNLRAKSGITGMEMTIIVSQTEGVLPSLTEFHHIREQDNYGIEGGRDVYHLCLLPDVNISRTTVRSKIDENPLLRRALNITSEMCQMSYLWHNLPEGLLCTPKELYDGLIAKGYDWKILLESRGWWTTDNDEHPIPFLSTMDLLRANAGLYHPYWYPVPKENLIRKVA